MKARHLLLAIVCLLPAGTLQAREPYASEAVGWEIAPFYGYRLGGDLDSYDDTVDTKVDIDDAGSYGLILEFPSGHHTQWQLLYSHQETQVQFDSPSTGSSEIDLTVDYLHLGGLYIMEGDRQRPFVGFGFGATRLAPAGDYDDEIEFSIAFTGGVKFRVTERFGLRFDARALGTLTDTSGAFLCSGGCIARFQGDGFWQYEFTLGANLYL